MLLYHMKSSSDQLLIYPQSLLGKDYWLYVWYLRGKKFKTFGYTLDVIFSYIMIWKKACIDLICVANPNPFIASHEAVHIRRTSANSFTFFFPFSKYWLNEDLMNKESMISYLLM